MANLFYRDVKYLFEVVITLWMFATSVLYPVADDRWKLGTVLELNPMTPIIDGYRDVMLRHRTARLGQPRRGARLLSVVALLAGAGCSFHRAEFEFAESI